MLFFSLVKFLPHFRVKLLFMLFVLLIAFQALSSIIKLHMRAFLGHPLIIITYALSVLLVLFFFSLMSITNLSLDLDFVVSLAMEKLKRGIDVIILSLIVFVFPEMLSFRNTTHLLNSFTPVLPNFLLCFRNLSKQVTFSFYKYFRSPIGLLYPTTKYFLCFSWITLK